MEKEKRTLRFGEVFGYGFGGMFRYGFQLCVTGDFLMYFMTDVAGFPTLLAAALNTAIQWIKMITMMFSGAIIDAINFKSGKYRTWTLVAGIGLGIFFPLSFVFFDMPTTAYATVFIIIYTIHTIFYNVGWTSMRALMGKMSRNGTDLISLNVAAQVGGTASSVVYGYVGPALLAISLWVGTKQAYAGISAIFGILIIAGAVLIYKLCGKYDGASSEAAVHAPNQEKIGFIQMLKSLRGPMIPYFFSYSFGAAQQGFFSTLLVYYSTYVLNDANAAAVALSITSLAALVGSFLVPSICKKFNKKAVYLGVQAICAVLYIALALFGRTSFSFIAIRALISFISTAGAILQSAICNDIGDHIEMKGEPAPRAFLQGLAGATNRVGMVISSMIASFGLAAIGYVAGVAFDASMISKLIALIAIGPAIVCAIAFIIMLFYKVDEKAIAEYNHNKYASQSTQ